MNMDPVFHANKNKQSLWQKIISLPLILKVAGIFILLAVATAMSAAAWYTLSIKAPTKDEPQTSISKNESKHTDKAAEGTSTTETQAAEKQPMVTEGAKRTPTAAQGQSTSPSTPTQATPSPSDPIVQPPPQSSRPNSQNTGVPIGTNLSNYSGAVTNNTSSTTFDNVNFPSPSGPGYYIFSGSNLTFRNCYFNGGLLLQGDNITIEHCTIKGGVSFSGTDTVSFRYNNIFNSSDDSLHITSDSGQSANIALTNNYIHSPTPSCGAHADGLQVRGVNGLSLINNAIDMGPWAQVCGQDTLNAAVFFESANGGNSDIVLDGNYLNGAGITLRLSPGADQKITNNRFGRSYYYAPVLNSTNPGDIILNTGNVMDDDGSVLNF